MSPTYTGKKRTLSPQSHRDRPPKQQFADAFTLEGADDEERGYLTIFRAVYRRTEELLCEDNAPAEKLIKSLLWHVSFRPMTQEDVNQEVEQSRPEWEQRQEANQIV